MDVAFITDAPLTLADGEAGNPPTSRIQVAELGRYQDPGRYGSFSITAEEVQNWQRVLADHFNGEVPIDLDHHTDKGISSEAAGWIKSLFVDGKRVFADVEWTPLGEKAILERRYKFISPTFVSELRNQVGKKLGPALLRAALTNSPFLRSMPAVSLSTAQIFAERVESDSHELADFTQEQRDQLAAKGHALPDGSFPIRNKDDLQNAVQAYGRAKDKASAKAHITKRAADLDATDLLPEGWDTTKLDAPVPICVGDRVAQSHPDLSLGKNGTVVRVHVQDIELETGGETVGVYVHDVVWDDATRTDAARSFDLRCLTPYRSLSAAERPAAAVTDEPDVEQMRSAFKTLAALITRS